VYAPVHIPPYIGVAIKIFTILLSLLVTRL